MLTRVRGKERKRRKEKERRARQTEGGDITRTNPFELPRITQDGWISTDTLRTRTTLHHFVVG